MGAPRALALAALAASASASRHPGAANCTTAWFTQRVDNYGWSPTPSNATTWQQRYLFNADAFRADGTGSIFLYVGNEGDVDLYANHSGLMWENAAEHGAVRSARD